jgi:Tfp pilus assembly protein PilF
MLRTAEDHHLTARIKVAWRESNGHISAASYLDERMVFRDSAFELGYYQEKRWTEADSLLHQALARDPNSLQAHEALANIDFERGQPAAAVKRLQEQFQKSPQDAGLAFLLGQAQARNSQQAEAEQSFSKAVELAPSNPGAILALATVQSARGETDAAIASYKRAIPLAPTNAQIVVSLGSL